MASRKTHRRPTLKQKEACKRNWVVFQLKGVLGFLNQGMWNKYSVQIRTQIVKVIREIKTLLKMVKEENAKGK